LAENYLSNLLGFSNDTFLYKYFGRCTNVENFVDNLIPMHLRCLFPD